MLRRSVHLQDVGYYTEEGTPTVSYREILYRLFRRRKGHGGGQHHMDSADPHESMNQNESTDTDMNHESTAPHESTANRLRSQNITSTERTRSIFTSDRTQTITSTERTRSIFTRYSTQSTITTDTTLSINTTDRTQRITCFLFLLLLAVGFTQYTHTCIQLKEIQQEMQMLKQWTNTFVPLADMMANFALESLGARVLPHLSSDTYSTEGAGIRDRLFFGCYSSKAQRRVIQGQSPLLPGQCWPFAGSQGHLFVSLSHPVSITHVTLGHIPKSQSPDGHISGAPREFSIYGMSTTDEEGTYLGTLVYDQDRAAFQTFELPNPDIGVFRYVKLQINSNWGHMENTCLYSFRVHSNSKV